MKPIPSALACIALLVHIVAPASASTLEMMAAANREMRLNDAFIPLEQRKAFAQALWSYWRSFEDRVPRLSPAEERWLKGEMASGSGDRLIQMVDKKEFSNWFLLDRAQSCMKIYAHLGAINQYEDKYEGYLWARSQSCYRSSDEVIRHLRQAGLTTGSRYDGAFNLQSFGLWEAYTIDTVVGSVLNPPRKP